MSDTQARGEQGVSRQEGWTRARQHEAQAASIRAQAEGFLNKARKHERWAGRWRAWAGDETGVVPFPGQIGGR